MSDKSLNLAAPNRAQETLATCHDGQWTEIEIGALARFSSGSGVSIAALHGQSTDFPVPVYGGNGIAGYTDRANVDVPTVVVGRVGQRCGQVHLTTGPALVTDNALYPTSILRQFDLGFFGLALSAARLNDVKNRNDLPLVTQAILHAVRLRWPENIAEQRAIAAPLSDVDALIGALDRLIAKKRDLKQAAMQQLLTGQTRLPGFNKGSASCPTRTAENVPNDWKSSTLGELASFSSGTTPPRAFADRYYRNGTTSWVKTLDLNNSFIDSTEERVTEHALRETSLRVHPPGTVLVAMYGGLNQIGRTGLLLIPAAVNQALAAIHANPMKINPEFLLGTLNFRVDYWSSVASSSRKDPNITSQDVKRFTVAFPSIEEQSAIAAVLRDLGSELSVLEHRRNKTRKLKQGMMQELLTGRIRLV